MHDVHSKSSSSEGHACMLIETNKQTNKSLKHIQPGVSNYLILSPHFAGREIHKL